MGLVVAQITNKKLGKAWSNTEGDLKTKYNEAYADWFTGSFDDYKAYLNKGVKSELPLPSEKKTRAQLDFNMKLKISIGILLTVGLIVGGYYLYENKK